MPPPLRFDILEEVSKRLPGFPIVLHGASSVPQEFVKIINENGGKMPDAVGIPEEQLRKAATHGRVQDQHRLRPAPGHDRPASASTLTSIRIISIPRQYLKPRPQPPSRSWLQHKIVDVLGCNGKA